jgi:predicted MPP superfamily phosphohydrolase
MVVFAVVVLVASLLFSAGHRYLWARLIRDADLPPRWARAATIALAVLFVVLECTVVSEFLLDQVLPRSVAVLYSWLGYGWLGCFTFLVMAVAVGDLGRALAARLRAPRDNAIADVERRDAITRIFAGGAVALGLGTAAYGVASALTPIVKRIQVALPKLTRASSGTRVVQITDIHVGPTIGRGFLEDIVARVNALSPDLVAITGDLVDGPVNELAEHVAPLAKLRAKHGVYFVTGNHEYYQNTDAWMAHLASLGVRVLRNERIRIGGDDGFDVAGVDDISGSGKGGKGHAENMAKALEGRDPGRACVLLAHQPRGIDVADKLGVDLQISGHTHGGQLFPWSILVALTQPFLSGLHKLSQAQIYVSRGTGYWGPPMRIGAPPEITEIELVSGA